MAPEISGGEVVPFVQPGSESLREMMFDYSGSGSGMFYLPCTVIISCLLKALTLGRCLETHITYRSSKLILIVPKETNHKNK
jgi:hypothetical protein